MQNIGKKHTKFLLISIYFLNKTNRQNNFLIHFFKHVNIACTPVISRINHSHR